MKGHDQIELLLKLHKLESNGDGVDRTRALQRLEKSLDPTLRKRYHKLKKRMGVGVAVLKNRVCSRCMMVYPESHEMLRYMNSVRDCEYCGRLLVVTDKSA